jgi:hypothetical protein
MTSEEIKQIVDWLNEWEQLKDTSIPMRFKEAFRPSTEEVGIKYAERMRVFYLAYESVKWYADNKPEILMALAKAAGILLVQIRTEPSEWFPLGAELTSLENGKLAIALKGTPREEIVGVVTLNGLKTK